VIYRTAFTRAIRQTCLAHLLRRANDLEADNPPERRIRESLRRFRSRA
jgi:hypothetical protein